MSLCVEAAHQFHPAGHFWYFSEDLTESPSVCVVFSPDADDQTWVRVECRQRTTEPRFKFQLINENSFFGPTLKV